MFYKGNEKLMKYLYSLLIVMLAFSLNAQDMNPIYKSIEKSDFKRLISHLDDPVELCINDEQEILDKKEAVGAIRSFFKSIKPTSITQIHKGTSSNKGSQYRVAKVNTDNGAYRLFIYIEKSKTGFIIKELRIDPES